MQEGLSSQEKQEPTPIPNPESVEKSWPETAIQTLIRTPFSESESALLPAFEDIQNDPHKQQIELLAAIGLVQGGNNGKYHPNNHVRCSDFVRVMVDLYRYQLGYDLNSTNGLTDKQLLSLQNPDSLLAKKLNTAKELGLLEGVAPLTRDIAITPLQVQQIINNALALHLNFGQTEKIKLIDTSKSVLTKSEMAKILAEIFQLDEKPKGEPFSDISNHQHQTAITKLAQLGVVAGRNGKFYPNNDVLRADGIVMIANSMLVQQRKALVINNFYHLNRIADVTYFAAYAPHLEYLLDHEIWTSLLHSTQSGNLFIPDAVLTQWEAYSLVAKAAGIKILNPDSWATTKPITRGQLAELLVEAFDFSPQVQEPNPTSTLSEQKSERWSTEQEKKKSLLVSLLKDAVNEL